MIYLRNLVSKAMLVSIKMGIREARMISSLSLYGVIRLKSPSLMGFNQPKDLTHLATNPQLKRNPKKE